MVRVGGFGSKVPAKVRDEVLARQAQMAAYKLAVFAAKADLRDNEGRAVVFKAGPERWGHSAHELAGRGRGRPDHEIVHGRR